MANELTITASMSFTKGNVAATARSVSALGVTVSGSRLMHHVQAVGTSEEAMVLGEVTSLGYCWMKNLDDTNFVTLKTGTGGTVVIKLKAGEVALFRFGSGITAPYLIADTASCNLEYLLIEA